MKFDVAPHTDAVEIEGRVIIFAMRLERGGACSAHGAKRGNTHQAIANGAADQQPATDAFGTSEAVIRAQLYHCKLTGERRSEFAR